VFISTYRGRGPIRREGSMRGKKGDLLVQQERRVVELIQRPKRNARTGKNGRGGPAKKGKSQSLCRRLLSEKRKKILA